MTRIQTIDPSTAPERTKALLDGVQKGLGMTPNMMKTMAQSPAVLEGYLSLSKALNGGVLSAKFRAQLAMAVGQTNGCDYCLSAHAALGKVAGLTPDQLSEARNASGAEAKTVAGLQFARQVVVNRGQMSDASFAAVRDAGFSDAEIAEILAHVAINVFTNYFNLVAGTEVDFPLVSAAKAA